MSIGEFSQMTHLSVRTLRRYHESGLLEPSEVDEWSGYRYYRADQIAAAQTIKRFRELGMPIREIAELLGAEDPADRTALIASHLARVEAELEQTRAAVLALRRLLQPAAPIEVERRRVPARLVAGVRARVALGEVFDWYSEAMIELDAVIARSGQRPTGPSGGVYDNALFTDEVGQLLVYVPVDEPPHDGRVHPVELAAAQLAVTVHCGPHTDIDVTYGALGTWVEAEGLAIAGPVHESYLVGPHNSADPETWRTEIGWPVETVETKDRTESPAAS